jgi:hypothetical protein
LKKGKIYQTARNHVKKTLIATAAIDQKSHEQSQYQRFSPYKKLQVCTVPILAQIFSIMPKK